MINYERGCSATFKDFVFIPNEFFFIKEHKTDCIIRFVSL